MKQTKTVYISAFYIALFFVSMNVNSQEIKDSIIYDLIVDEEVIGDLFAVKSYNTDSTFNYKIISNVDYRFLFSFHITFLYESMFSSKGVYTSSQFKYTMNEDVKEYKWVNYIGGKWYVYEENEVINIIDEKINQTAVQLYFEEPDDALVVFSERFCDFYTIEKGQDNGYKIEFPGGTNKYYYENGICNKVEINTIFSDMEFRKRPY